MHRSCIRGWYGLTAVVILLALGNPDLRAAGPPPVEAFAELPPIADIHLSPDGSRAVMLRAVQGSYQVVVADFASGDMRMLMASDPEQFLFNWCRWANAERIVCSIRSYGTLRAGRTSAGLRRYQDGRIVFTRLLAINADGSGQVQLVPEAVTRPGERLEWNPPDQDTVLSWLPEEPQNILVQLAREDRVHPTPYRLDIHDNRLRRVRRHHSAVARWFADRSGELRFGAGFRDLEPVGFSVRDNDLEEVDLSAVAGIRPPQLLGFAPNGGAYVLANMGQNTRGLYRMDPATGEVLETLHSDPDFDSDGTLVTASADGRALVLYHARETPAVTWFDAGLAQRVRAARESVPGQPSRARLITADQSLETLILRIDGNGARPRYFLYDHGEQHLMRLAESYPGLPGIVEPRPVTIPARDGTPVPAYLTLPPGGQRKGLPTVILPHGGPWSRDTGAPHYWVQFLVSRGYAVLQPNFRGSSGHGDRYLAAGFEQWGLAMQNDLVDGLDWLVEQGIADPERVCMVGGSYGGYAALVAAYQIPERLRCAVSFAGVSDLDGVVERMRNFRFGELGVARIQEGDARRRSSPIHNVERIGVPLLLVHGDVDRSVLVEQSRSLADALEAAGKPFRYIEQTNGDHYLSLQAHRLEFLEALEGFLQTHLGG
jgi:dipeptidyl aminopeptidase/acylaminoacyl peptidase